MRSITKKLKNELKTDTDIEKAITLNNINQHITTCKAILKGFITKTESGYLVDLKELVDWLEGEVENGK